MDDSTCDVLLLERTLQQAKDATFSVTCVAAARAGLDERSTNSYDLVLLDDDLPDMGGLAFLQIKQQRGSS
jgi:DNA-binding response OmpR family regulator